MEVLPRILLKLAAYFMPILGSDSEQEDSEVPDSEDILSAIRTNDMQAVERFISAGGCFVSFHIVNGIDVTPFMLASKRGRNDIVVRLIQQNVNINQSNSIGLSALHLASSHGHSLVVDTLIKAKANVNCQDKLDGITPVYIASQNNHRQVVELLINGGADVNLQRKSSESSLHIASQNGHKDVVKLLIGARANVNIKQCMGCSPIYVASQAGHYQVVLALIEAQADINLQRDTGHSPLYVASRQGHQQVVDALVSAGANANISEKFNGETALFIASRQGHHQVVHSLIKARANVDQQRKTGESPLYTASQQGHQKVVDLLIQAKADVDLQQSTGKTPLYVAAANGHDKVVASLIKAQADVNIAEKLNSECPLYIASQNGHHKVVQMLIRAQADVTLQRKTGESALYIASQNDHYAIVESLLKACWPDCTPNLIESAWMRALEFGSERCAEMLQRALTGVFTHFTPRSRPERFPTTDVELSRELHKALNQSGFVESRAAMQSAIADVIQVILNSGLNADNYFVVGSFSEGWGNSLTTLDGKTDKESDIDVMRLIKGDPFHLNDLCKCCDVTTQKVQYNNGHVASFGYASRPSTEYKGSTLRPAVDLVDARRLCCYPPIGPLSIERVQKSNIHPLVLESVSQNLTSAAFPCHVVHATSPGKPGEQLRVSTSFLERLLLRSLSTIPGQLFIILKWLLKKAVRHSGFKSYHAKNITFRMLEETPDKEWVEENLVSLTRRSLKILERGCRSGSADGRIINHFFLSDAAVYLRGVDLSSEEKTIDSLNEAADAVKDAIDKLPELLLEFKDGLRPVTESGRFHFHPFLIMPLLFDAVQRSVFKTNDIEYAEIYYIVRRLVLWLSTGDARPESKVQVFELIEKLPDCARTARESLKALALIKFRDRVAAARVLSDCETLSASRGIDWPIERQKSEVTTDFVWQHLMTKDSAWKFCFPFNTEPELELDTEVLNQYFPLRMKNHETNFFINFEALLQAVRFGLLGAIDSSADDWIRDVAEKDDSDEQELVVAAANCEDVNLLQLLRKRSTKLFGDVPQWLEIKFRELTELGKNGTL